MDLDTFWIFNFWALLFGGGFVAALTLSAVAPYFECLEGYKWSARVLAVKSLFFCFLGGGWLAGVVMIPIGLAACAAVIGLMKRFGIKKPSDPTTYRTTYVANRSGAKFKRESP